MNPRQLLVRLAVVPLGLLGFASATFSIEGGTELVHRLRQGPVAGFEVELGGALVSALAARPDELLLLVRPAAEIDGARRLLRLSLAGEPALESVAEGLPGWTKTLAAIDLGSGPELVVGGLERVDSLGALSAPTPPPRPLVAHPGLDLRSLHPERLRRDVERELAAVEAGRLRVWRPDREGGLRLEVDARLPLRVEREATGLAISSPPVALLSGTAWCGPEARGARRLRVTGVPLDGEGETSESWLALPGVESVEHAWLLELDGAPALALHTQGAAKVDVFERQRYRVFDLGGDDRTRAGRAPRLAVEVDSKRWHDTSIAAGDVDLDGHDDLILVRPEGMTGGDLVVQVFPGAGGVSFEHRARRTDLDEGPDEWRIVEDPDDPARPALATLGGVQLELHRFAASGRRALERRPLLSYQLGDPRRAERMVTVRAGDEGASVETSAAAGHELLGSVPTARGSLLLLLSRDEIGAERLLALGNPAPAPAALESR